MLADFVGSSIDIVSVLEGGGATLKLSSGNINAD